MRKSVVASVAIAAVAGAFVLKATAADNVTIGFAIAKSGWMNAYDGPPLNGSMMAIEDFNAQGGILGKQIKAVVADTKTDVVEGAKAGAQVIADGAQFMAVSCDYDMGAPAATVANDHKMIAISYCASDAKMGVQGIGPYAFSLEIYGQGEGAVAAAFAWKRGWKTAYALLDASIEYDKSVCDGFLEYFTKLGGKVLGVDTFQQEDASIASQVTRYKDSAASNGEPAVMVLCSYVPGAATAIRQIRAGGINVPIMGGDSMDGDYWVASVPGLSNHYTVTFGSKWGDDTRPEVNEFFKRYRAKYGEPEVFIPAQWLQHGSGHQARGRESRFARYRGGLGRTQQVQQAAASVGRHDFHAGNPYRPDPPDDDRSNPEWERQFRRPDHGRGSAQAQADVPRVPGRPV